MDNVGIARALSEVADLLEITGANPFRIRAYRNAVRTIEAQTVPLSRLVEEHRDLTELPGIGKEMCSHVEELVGSGKLSVRERLLADVPHGLIDLMRLPNLGPKRARQLHDALGVASVDELETAAKEGRVAAVKGFGDKSQEKILAGIADYRRHQERMRLSEVERHVRPLVAYLREVPGLTRLEVAGSYRRRCETVGDLDLLGIVEREDAARRVMERFLAYPQVAGVSMAGDTRASVVLGSGVAVDLRLLPPESYGAALVYFTGSKEHNVRLRQRALAQGLTLSEYGLFELEDDGRPGRRRAGAEEAEVYAALGLAWVPPEIREDRGEIRAAAAGRLPRLLEEGDLRGDLHMHSTWSDGRNTIAEMLAACAARGYEYLALTDHSQALAMARGLDEERLREQWREIDEVRAAHPEIRLLRGLEVDVLADGALDLADDMLERLDLVVASVHSRFELPAAEQTRRIVRALEHPQVNVLAHPTGRLINRRKPYDFDLEEVLACARENGVAVELNASPERLDLRDVHLARARELGVPVVISTDAHAVHHLGFVRYGVEQARRAWLEPRHVVNAWPLSEVLSFLRKEPPATGYNGGDP